jgi:hypothetical protein
MPFYFISLGMDRKSTHPKDGNAGGPRSKIQVLVPQDYSSKPGLEVPGIPDRTIGFLLDKIAHNKGDNIVSLRLAECSVRKPG